MKLPFVLQGLTGLADSPPEIAKVFLWCFDALWKVDGPCKTLGTALISAGMQRGNGLVHYGETLQSSEFLTNIF